MTLVTALGWSLVGGLALPALWRVTSRDGHLLAVWTLTLTPWLGAASAVAAVGAAWLRRPVLVVAALGLGVVYTVWTRHEWGIGTHADLPEDAVRFRLLTANLYYRNPVPDETAAALAAIDADVFLLQEVGAELAAALRSVGLCPGNGHGTIDVHPDGDGSAILARSASLEATATTIGGRPSTTATLDLDGCDVRLINAHPRAPMSSVTCRQWSRQLAALRDRVAGEDLATVVAGDFNATGFHRALREVVQTGELRDAHRTSGRGLGFTWPVNSRLLPRVFRPDRVYLSRQLRAGRLEYVTLPGNDHAAVVVEVSFI